MLSCRVLSIVGDFQHVKELVEFIRPETCGSIHMEGAAFLKIYSQVKIVRR